MTQPTITLQHVSQDHDGRCDHDDGACGQPARLAKLAAAQPWGWKVSAPAASLAVYCCRSHADQDPTATLEDAWRTYEHLPPMGSMFHRVLQGWQVLLDAYPEPVALASSF